MDPLANVWGIPALFGLNQVSNFLGFTVVWGLGYVGFSSGFGYIRL